MGDVMGDVMGERGTSHVGITSIPSLREGVRAALTWRRRVR